MFALADCNNFYASCERVFNPALRNRPVVVLSNNDGCVIARSAEAKQLGIRMGVPAFQIEKLLTDHQVAVFSSNYALYGDLSLRVMNTLASFVPSMEIYSIDEAFLDFSGIGAEKILPLAQEIRKTVMRDTGIPIGIGIAPTKTLAKIANHLAKKSSGSICFIHSDEEITQVLKETQVGEIWGIGKQYTAFLNRHGIETAYDLSRAPDNWIKKNLTVVGLRTKKELTGISCLSLDEIVPDKKAICTSRSFGNPQTGLPELEEAVSTFAVRCAEKLRRQKSAASQIMVFIHTNAFRSDLPQYARNRVIDLSSPTNSSIDLVKQSVEALRSIYRKGYSYKKAGVIATGLVPEQEIQQDLFSEAGDSRHKKLMESMDEINRYSYRPLIQIATQGTGRKWKLRQEQLSPKYTTRWNEIMEIRV
jgi:DNA polymerase V